MVSPHHVGGRIYATWLGKKKVSRRDLTVPKPPQNGGRSAENLPTAYNTRKGDTKRLQLWEGPGGRAIELWDEGWVDWVENGGKTRKGNSPTENTIPKRTNQKT